MHERVVGVTSIGATATLQTRRYRERSVIGCGARFCTKVAPVADASTSGFSGCAHHEQPYELTEARRAAQQRAGAVAPTVCAIVSLRRAAQRDAFGGQRNHVIKANISALRLLKRREEFVPAEKVDDLPRGMRGIYVLYKHRARFRRFDVVYVGMAAEGGIRPRLRSHRARKKALWTHCSV